MMTGCRAASGHRAARGTGRSGGRLAAALRARPAWIHAGMAAGSAPAFRHSCAACRLSGSPGSPSPAPSRTPATSASRSLRPAGAAPEPPDCCSIGPQRRCFTRALENGRSASGHRNAGRGWQPLRIGDLSFLDDSDVCAMVTSRNGGSGAPGQFRFMQCAHARTRRSPAGSRFSPGKGPYSRAGRVQYVQERPDLRGLPRRVIRRTPVCRAARRYSRTRPLAGVPSVPGHPFGPRSGTAYSSSAAALASAAARAASG